LKESLEKRREVYNKIEDPDRVNIDGFLSLKEKYGEHGKRIDYQEYLSVLDKLGYGDLDEKEKKVFFDSLLPDAESKIELNDLLAKLNVDLESSAIDQLKKQRDR
jgi:hypothetical protein